MPQVACNQDICLCLGLKSTEAISLLRVKKKSRHCSSSSREHQQFFSLPFSNAGFVAETSFAPLPFQLPTSSSSVSRPTPRFLRATSPSRSRSPPISKTQRFASLCVFQSGHLGLHQLHEVLM